MVVEKTIGMFASRSRDVSFIPSNHYITICYSFSLFRHNTVLNPNLMDVNIVTWFYLLYLSRYQFKPVIYNFCRRINWLL